MEHDIVKFPPVVSEDLQIDSPALQAYGRGKLIVPGNKAVINPETGHVFDIVSDKYKLVKHEDVLANVEDVLVKNDSMGPCKREVRLYQHGARMRTTYTFYETGIAIKSSIAKGDIVNPTIEVFNSYDRSIRHTVMMGAFRVICTNGMVVGIEFMQFRKRHMPDLYLDDVKQAMEIGMDKMEVQMLTWDEWTKKPLEKETLENTLKVLDLNQKETRILEDVEEVSSRMSISRWLALFEMGDSYEEERQVMSWWVFYNILTQFTTHEIKSQNRRLQLETRIRKALYS